MREKEKEEGRKSERVRTRAREAIREKERERGLERSQGKENKSKGGMEEKRERKREDGRRGWERRKQGGKKNLPQHSDTEQIDSKFEHGHAPQIQACALKWHCNVNNLSLSNKYFKQNNNKKYGQQ